MPIDPDEFIDKVIIKQAMTNLKDSGNLMPVFFLLGVNIENEEGEVGIVPVLGDLGKSGAKEELLMSLKQIKEDTGFHTAIFLSDAYVRSYETKSWDEAMAERDKIPGSLKDDPKATEAIIIAKMSAGGGSTQMIAYKTLDDGAYVFDEPMNQTNIYASWMTRIWDNVN